MKNQCKSEISNHHFDLLGTYKKHRLHICIKCGMVLNLQELLEDLKVNTLDFYYKVATKRSENG